jgi:hypothetical protein
MATSETHEECIKRWEKTARGLLVGRKIVAARYMTAKEAKMYGWQKKCVVIQLDNDTLLFPSMDDEGNDGGALFTSSDEVPTLPVIRDYSMTPWANGDE